MKRSEYRKKKNKERLLDKQVNPFYVYLVIGGILFMLIISPFVN